MRTLPSSSPTPCRQLRIVRWTEQKGREKNERYVKEKKRKEGRKEERMIEKKEERLTMIHSCDNVRDGVESITLFLLPSLIV